MATTIRFQGLVKTTAEIEADKFAGRVGWSTTLARYIAYYNSTQYAQMARRDVLETFVAGLQDSTLGVGLPMFAGTSGRLSTESAASFRARIAAVNKAGDTMTGPLTLSAGNLNVGAGAIQTAGVTRISNGGAGTLTTLSTTGMVTAAQATISDIPAGSVVRATTGGRLAGDAGLVAGTYNGVTQDLTIGNGIAYDTAAQLSLNTADSQRTSVFFKSASVPNWAFTCRGNAEAVPRQLMLRAYLAGVEVDQPLTVEQASAGVITLGGATARPVNFTGAIQTAGVTRISSGGAGSLTTLVTTGLTTVQSLNISGLTGSRMLSLDASKNVQALDAAGSRALIGALAASEKGAANGVAPLGSDSKIAAAYLPAYVDDVLEFANLAAFPVTGESGKIYVAIDTAKTYRWSGSAYVVISETLALGETSSTAYRGDRGKTAYDHSQLTASNPHGTTFAQIASKPTTLEGYGITDGVCTTGVTICDNAGILNPRGSIQCYSTVPLDGNSTCVGLNSGNNGTATVFFGKGQGLLHARIGYDIDGTSDHVQMHSGFAAGSGFVIKAIGSSGAFLDAEGGFRVQGNPVLGVRKTGWAAATGTATRSTFATSTVTLPQLAERLKALIDDLTAHGLIGA